MIAGGGGRTEPHRPELYAVAAQHAGHLHAHVGVRGAAEDHFPVLRRNGLHPLPHFVSQVLKGVDDRRSAKANAETLRALELNAASLSLIATSQAKALARRASVVLTARDTAAAETLIKQITAVVEEERKALAARAQRSFDSNAAALGFKDGEDLRLQAGTMFGHTYVKQEGYIFTNSIGTFLYSDVYIHGFVNRGLGFSPSSVLADEADSGSWVFFKPSSTS